MYFCAADLVDGHLLWCCSHVPEHTCVLWYCKLHVFAGTCPTVVIHFKLFPSLASDVSLLCHGLHSPLASWAQSSRLYHYSIFTCCRTLRNRVSLALCPPENSGRCCNGPASEVPVRWLRGRQAADGGQRARNGGTGERPRVPGWWQVWVCPWEGCLRVISSFRLGSLTSCI